MGKCYNSIVVNKPVDQVWDTIKSFHDTSWAKGVVETCEVVGDAKGDQLGAKRVLNGVFHETLVGLNNRERTIQYTINEGPGPLAKGEYLSYVGDVRVFAVSATDHTFVEWTSEYEGGNDAAITELCSPIYHALLGALKTNMES